MRSDIESALNTWERENANTLAVLRAVPPAQNRMFAARNHSWRLDELAWHICISEWWFCTGVMKMDPPDENPVPPSQPPETVAEMADALVRSHALLVRALRDKTEAWFDTHVDFHGEPWTRLQLLHLLLRHEAHHRGQLSVYLWIAGEIGPTIYGADGATMEEYAMH